MSPLSTCKQKPCRVHVCAKFYTNIEANSMACQCVFRCFESIVLTLSQVRVACLYIKKKNLISCLFPDHVGDNPSTRDSWSISSLKKKLLKLVGSKVPHALRKLVNLSGYRSRHHMINVIFSLHTGRQTIWVMHGKYWYITNLAIDVSWCT